MIVGADWLVPVSGRPIRTGAVFLRGSRVDAVGPLAELRAASPAEPVETFDGCVIIPGLVDAHTRLSLTVLRGLIEARATRDFLRDVDRATLAMSNDDFAASASLGAVECLRNGITAVGDIGYGPEPLASCADAGVGGVFYWEVRGLEAHSLGGELAEMEFPAEVGACSTGRVRCGISPQGAFTSGPALIKAAWQVSHTHRTGFAIHAAESQAERDLMVRGTGPLADVARMFARDFKAPRTGTIAYLEDLGALKDAVVLGAVHLEPGDAARLKRHARGVVLCTLSSAALGNGMPHVGELSAAGVKVALGTGSPATSAGNDLFAEARALRETDASLTSRRLLAMMTSEGAATLGLGDMFGALAPGLQSDLAVIRTGPTEDPETAVVRCGSADTVRAVLAGGVWRVRDGKPSLPTGATERAAERARSVVKRALGVQRGERD